MMKLPVNSVVICIVYFVVCFSIARWRDCLLSPASYLTGISTHDIWPIPSHRPVTCHLSETRHVISQKRWLLVKMTKIVKFVEKLSRFVWQSIALSTLAMSAVAYLVVDIGQTFPSCHWKRNQCVYYILISKGCKIIFFTVRRVIMKIGKSIILTSKLFDVILESFSS